MRRTKRLPPSAPERYGLSEFIRDMLANAPVERASVWLQHAALEYPNLAAEFREGLHETPSQVINRLARHVPQAHALHLSPAAKQFIARLQAALK
jgi:hypothetical protein